jgi:hypothetical protein
MKSIKRAATALCLGAAHDSPIETNRKETDMRMNNCIWFTAALAAVLVTMTVPVLRR